MNKKKLALKLSELKEFTKGKTKLEQYPTPPEIAADILWKIHMQNDIKNKTIADLGCGHGIIGIGALILNAKKVYFIEIDKELIDLTKENLKDFKKESYQIQNKNIQYINLKTDVIIQNPPFGVKQKHNDKFFLSKAMHIAPKVYSFHKTSTRKFIEKFCKDNGYKANLLEQYKFPLKKSMAFHKKNIQYVDVDFWQIKKLF